MLALALCAGLGCSPTPPPLVAREAHALAPLDLGPLRLLPAAAVTPAPSPGPAPAFAAPATPPDASRSIGPSNAGALVGGVALTPGPHLAFREPTLRRDARFGTAALVGMLERAAARVARDFPGSVLWVGDLSRETGGPIPPHASHQSGRDVDLSFYVSDGEAPADESAMRYVDGEGRVPATGKRFDVARNWALVEAFLEDPGAQVQWIFVASHLRSLLLDHARALGSPMLDRAERVLAEPRDSSPHADHFHVRVYCGLEERLEGCLDAGPFHPWVDRHEAALTRWLEGLLPFLGNPRRPEIDRAIEGIVRMNATSALSHLEPLLAHPDPGIARLARDAVDFLRGHRTPAAWARWRAEDTGD